VPKSHSGSFLGSQKIGWLNKTEQEFSCCWEGHAMLLRLSFYFW